MEAKEWQVKLTEDARFDSDWIAEASKILENHEDLYDKIINLTPPQLNAINEILADESANIDIDKIINSGLNATQMRLYWQGIAQGVNEETMELFLDPTIPYAKTNFIVQALIEGYSDILEYMNFETDQIVEIYAGMKDGVEYSLYAVKECPALIMNLLRHALFTRTPMNIDIPSLDTIFEIK